MVVSRPEVAEQMLLAGELPCPRCRVCFARSATAGTRTVRGVGAETVTVTPRRARCADCRVTQILLPTALIVRCADSTEAIGNALVAHARGAGHRSIAARLGRPESTVRRWLRGVRDPHAQWLYRRGVDRAAAIDRELLVRPAPQRTTLGHALNLLAGAALRYRDRFGVAVPVWALIGSFARGRLLAPPHPRRS
jgi:hypothetical protein